MSSCYEMDGRGRSLLVIMPVTRTSETAAAVSIDAGLALRKRAELLALLRPCLPGRSRGCRRASTLPR
jgi:hypothetical protein